MQSPTTYQSSAQRLSAPCGLLVFDLETDGLCTPAAAPPPILCAASLQMMPTQRRGQYTVAEPCRTWPASQDCSELPARPMSDQEILDFVGYLAHKCTGAPRMRLSGWNAVGFDCKVLAAHCMRIAKSSSEEQTKKLASDLHCKLQILAWDCADPMLNFFMCKGFPVRLAAVAATLPNALCKNGEGAKAADDWLQGNHRDRQHVLQYCANDCLMTAAVLSQLDQTDELKWISRKEKENTWKPPMGARTLHAPAYEAFTWKFPDNSWLKKRPRDIQHSAGKELRQENSEREIGSNETVEKVQIDDLPKPSNYFWMQK